MVGEQGHNPRIAPSGKTIVLAIVLFLGLMALVALNACGGPGSQTVVQPYEESPRIDPHEPRDLNLYTLRMELGSTYGYNHAGGKWKVETLLEKGLDAMGLSPSPVHIVFRGTADVDSFRCKWEGRARTLSQRDAYIRYLLEIDEGGPLPPVAELQFLFMRYIEDADAVFREALDAYSRDLMKGGLSINEPHLNCFADYSVAEYLLGTGPASLTVLSGSWDWIMSYALYEQYPADALDHRIGESGALSEGDYWAFRNQELIEIEEFLSGLLGGYEGIVFLAPAGDHNNVITEAWEAVDLWDLQTGDGVMNAVRYGTNAVRYGTDEKDPEHTQTTPRPWPSSRVASGQLPQVTSSQGSA